MIIDTVKKRWNKSQKGIVIWIFGLPCSGKSSLAESLSVRLSQKGYFVKRLDGDNLRKGISSNLGFSKEDRKENIRRAAEIARLFSESGIVAICSFISPTKEIRNMAKSIIGASLFFDVFAKCPIHICAKRDVKGLYKRATAGEIEEFTGVSAPFENPEITSCTVDTSKSTIYQCVEKIHQSLTDRYGAFKILLFFCLLF